MNRSLNYDWGRYAKSWNSSFSFIFLEELDTNPDKGLGEVASPYFKYKKGEWTISTKCIMDGRLVEAEKEADWLNRI